MVVAQEQPYYTSVPRKSHRARKKTRFHYLPRRVRLVLVGLVLLIFCTGILVVYLYAQTLVAGYRLNEMKKEINDLNTQTQMLSENIARLSSLERVEKVAKAELGMIKPDLSQMILVKADLLSTDEQVRKVSEPSSEVIAVNPKEKGNWIIQALVRLVEGRGNCGPS